VENVGSSLAKAVTVTDVLPAGLTYVSNSQSATSTDITASFSSNGSQLIWSIASFPQGESLKITLKVKADQIGLKTNMVEVKAAPQVELTPADNVAEDTNEILAFFIPNVITPGDKDNKNDAFVIHGIERFSESRLVIFNRWGNHVLEADNYQNNWDATGLSAGSYYYVLELTDGNNKKQSFKGWVQVIKD
jgi:gliding motility-associated-like protein